MRPIPYVFFNGDCRQAMTRYAEIFGTSDSLSFVTVSDMPAEDQPHLQGLPQDSVMHAAVQIGEGWLYGSDTPGGETKMSGASLSIDLKDEAETRRVYDALAEGADISMELAPTSWAPLFSMLTDRFGIVWMIGQVTPE